MLDRLRQRTSSEEGFTLVELLVVMLIIGLLAAIAIPSFFNQRDKAKDSDAKTTARTAQTALETYATDNDGSYAGATVALLVAIEETLSEAVVGPPTLAVTPTADSYNITVTSETGNEFRIDRANTGGVTLSCDTANEGGCPNGNRWD